MSLSNEWAEIALDQRLARIAVRPLAKTPITPNMLTTLGMAFGLAAAWLLSHGEPWATHSGAALFVIAAWMDHVDGEHARLTGKTSRFGHYYDHAAAMTTYIAMFIGVGFGERHGPLGEWAVPLGIAAGIAVASIFTIRMWMEIRLGGDSVRQAVRGGFEIEDTLYIVAPVAWLGGLIPFLVASGIGAPLFLVYVVWTAVAASDRKRREAADG